MPCHISPRLGDAQDLGLGMRSSQDRTWSPGNIWQQNKSLPCHTPFSFSTWTHPPLHPLHKWVSPIAEEARVMQRAEPSTGMLHLGQA